MVATEPLMNSKAYRDAFAIEYLRELIACQVKAKRLMRGWSSTELGERAGLKQERISIIEDPEGAMPTLTTLMKLAAAFDVVLDLRLLSFDESANLTAVGEREV